MKFGARQRWIVLIVLLTLALTAAAWVRDSGKQPEGDVVEAPARNARVMRAPATSSVERVALEKLRNHGLDDNNGDPFAPRSWQKPEPRRAPGAADPGPPPPPTAPPLPFVYLGRLASEEDNAVFLALGERNLVVHEGDIVDSTYRVDQLAETQVTLTHLPTGIRQILVMGEAQ